MGLRKLSTVSLLLAVLAVALLSGCTEAPANDIPEPTGVPEETVRVSVFFSTGRTIVEEPRVLDATDTYGQVFAEFIGAQPEINPDVAIVQPEATITSVTVADGVMTIDWSRDVLSFEADDSEKTLALAAILLNAGQFPQVSTVVFTVEGKTSGELDGKDIAYFWGRVSLKGQPFEVLRPPRPSEEGQETTSTARVDEAPSSETTSTATE
ncbi:MAG: GerMN domain-containing protein [Thermoleophilia bacterium]|nr:GerMN domain-containing protein [Thermoleophilia bacterium]